MREIVLDTETTGFDPDQGHRLIEIGCVELHHFVPTGRTYHCYINPERDVPAEATAVHGLTTAFLADKPVVAEIFADLMEFIGDTPLVIHNAEFDMKFLNAEGKKLGFRPFPNTIVDTLIMARQMFPGQPASLDALCKRYKIDNAHRNFHGALLDAELLAEVYLELKGGRQQGLRLDPFDDGAARPIGGVAGPTPLVGAAENRSVRPARSFPPLTAAEAENHAKMVESLGGQAIWKQTP